MEFEFRKDTNMESYLREVPVIIIGIVIWDKAQTLEGCSWNFRSLSSSTFLIIFYSEKIEGNYILE